MKRAAGRSVTLRLTLLFAAVSTSVLMALGLAVGTLVEDHFAETDAALLAGKLELISHAIAAPDAGTLRARLDAALVGHHGLSVTVWDAEGRSLYATGAAAFPTSLARAAAAHAPAPVRMQALDGRPIRVLGGSALSPDRRRFAIAVSIDLAAHETFMHSFNVTLWSAVALAALASGLLGWIAARRGLAPLRDISRNAAGITADRLDRRLPVESIPDELAEVARTLNDMLARLEDSFRRLSDFSSDLAHELRTPVTNLLTQTQVTLSRERSAEAYREVLASNAEEFERLSRMIADMLFLAKAEHELVVPAPAQVDLRAEADSILEFYEALAEEQGIALSVTGQASAAGDRLMLRRAIGNLVSNAFRHTPRGGSISVRIDANKDANKDADVDDAVCVAIANTGPAIPQEHLPRLFDRFYRADPSRQRDSEGAGLGLAITRSIMRAHGGDATVRPEAGLTVFELHIPPGARHAGPPADGNEHDLHQTHTRVAS